MTKTIDNLLDAMTLEEQVSLLSGEDFWSLPAIERLGIGKLRVSDGPNGARGGGGLLGGVKATAFPVGISLGATWNVELLREPNESRRLDLHLDARAFAFFNVERQAWIVAPGNYRLILATDALSSVATASVSRATQIELTP